MRELADESAALAGELQKEGFSMRDIAELVGTPPRRVQQWVTAPAPQKRKRARKGA